MKKYIYLVLLAFVVWSCDEEDKLIDDRLAGNPDITVTPQTGDPGTLDLSKYIALGASVTGGYQDGTLYTNGQQTCFPALLTEQFKLGGIGGGDYGFPDIGSINGFSTSSGGGKLFLLLDSNCDGVLGDVGFEAQEGENTLGTPYGGVKGDITNFGVPGIASVQFDQAGLGNPASPYFNPYYARFASNPGTSTLLNDAIANNPTFFTLWMGGNDVLGYAVGGGTNPALLTSQSDFQNYFSNAVGKLAATGASGIVINVPPIVVLPYFRAIKWNDAKMDEGTAAALNAGFAGFNGALDAIVANMGFDATDAARRKVSYVSGLDDCGNELGNPFLIQDLELTDLGPYFDQLQGAGAIDATQRAGLAPFEQARPLRSTELVAFSAGSFLGEEAIAGNPTSIIGVAVPLAHPTLGGSDMFILDEAEQGEIIKQRATLNGTIAGVMGSGLIPANIKLLDIQPIFADLFGLSPEIAGSCVAGLCMGDAAVAAADAQYNEGNCKNLGLGTVKQGYNYQPDFSPNGVFSNDGIHLNPRGHAILSNEIISILNKSLDNGGFGASIPNIEIAPLRASPFKACPD